MSRELFETIFSEEKMDLLGLRAPAEAYGFKPLTHNRLERFFVGTSSSRSYRRCRRKWGFESSYRLGLEHEQAASMNIHFWFGSAIHFAMEDYFGYNHFGDPRRAFKAYYDAFDAFERPIGAEEHYELGIGMLEHFMMWYPRHNTEHFETAWFYEPSIGLPWEPAEPHAVGAIPGTEVSICLNLGLQAPLENDGTILPENNGLCQTVPVCFHGTIDRIVKDWRGDYWLLDYKTAKIIDTGKLETDDQISRYCWAAEQYLGIPIKGFIYLQMAKTAPKKPKILAKGGLSTDKRQKTTYDMYRKAIIDMYKEVSKAPSAVIDTLNELAEKQTPEGDDFIRWDFVHRSDLEKAAVYTHVLAEAQEMLNTNNYLMPSPTKDCAWDCPFRGACIALDRGNYDDFQEALIGFAPRTIERSERTSGWEKNIKWPAKRPGPVTPEELCLDTQEFNIILPEKKEEK